ANGHGYCLIFGDAQPVYDGISDQRVRGKHTRNEHTGTEAVAKQIVTHGEPNGNGKQEGEKPKNKTLVLVLVELIHVQFKPGDEHDVQQADGRKKINGRILLNEKQTVRTDNHPGQNQSDDTGYFEPVEDDRREENNGQNQ